MIPVSKTQKVISSELRELEPHSVTAIPASENESCWFSRCAALVVQTITSRVVPGKTGTIHFPWDVPEPLSYIERISAAGLAVSS